MPLLLSSKGVTTNDKVKNMSEEELIKAIWQYGAYILKFANNPSKRVKMEARKYELHELGLTKIIGTVDTDIESILGKNKYLKSMFKKGKFTVGIGIYHWMSEALAYNTNYIGYKAKYPKILEEFFRYCLCKLKSNFKDYSLEGICITESSEKNEIILQIIAEDDIYDICVKQKDDGSLISISGGIFDDSFLPILEEVLREVLYSYPIPINQIEYWVLNDKHSIDGYDKYLDIGTGKEFYIGFTDCVVDNGLVGLEDDNLKGEYAVVFVEIKK